MAPARRPPPHHPSCRASPVPSGTALYVNPCVQIPLGRPRERGALAPLVLPDPRVRLRAEAGTPLVLQAARTLPARPSGCSGNSRCCVRVAAMTCAPLGAHTQGPCLLRGCLRESLVAGQQAPVASGGALPPPMQLRPPLTRGRAGRRRLASARVTLQGHGGNLMESAARRHSCPRAVVRSGDTQAQDHPPANRRCGPKQAQLEGAWRRGSQPLWCKQEGCDWFWL